MAKLVSKVYGDALFSLAVEEDNLDTLWDEVKVLSSVLEQDGEFIGILAHPEMTQEKSIALIKEAFEGKFSERMMGFLQVLVKKGRFGEILSILNHFDERAKEYKKIGVVYVTTPVELDATQKEKIESRLHETSGYESFEMNYVIDKALLGGIRIRIGNRVIDNTIQTKLEEMTRSLCKVRV